MSLIREYRYARDEVAVEFGVKLGTAAMTLPGGNAGEA